MIAIVFLGVKDEVMNMLNITKFETEFSISWE